MRMNKTWIKLSIAKELQSSLCLRSFLTTDLLAMPFQLLCHFKRFSLANTTSHVLEEGWDMTSHIFLWECHQKNASETKVLDRKAKLFKGACLKLLAHNLRGPVWVEGSSMMAACWQNWWQSIELAKRLRKSSLSKSKLPRSQGCRMYADRRSFVRMTSVESFVEKIEVCEGWTEHRPSSGVFSWDNSTWTCLSVNSAKD